MLDLRNNDWQGTTRELQDVIERTVITCRCGLEKFDLSIPENSGRSSQQLFGKRSPEKTGRVMTDEEMRQGEKDNIIVALHQTDWKIMVQTGLSLL